MIDLNIEAEEFNPPPTSGNPTPRDLSEFPVVDIIGPDSLQVVWVLESEDKGEERGRGDGRLEGMEGERRRMGNREWERGRR